MDAEVHHGVPIYGFVRLLRVLPHLIEAAERSAAASDKQDAGEP